MHLYFKHRSAHCGVALDLLVFDIMNLSFYWRSHMSNAVVHWVAGRRFIGTDSTNHSVVLSTPDEGIGMKPSELLLVALSSCTAVDVVDILKKKRSVLTRLEIQSSGEQDADPPWTYRKIHLKYILAGKGLTPRDVEQTIQLSQDKYCSVAATLRGRADITWEYEIEPNEPGE
jgi:putative redox protein